MTNERVYKMAFSSVYPLLVKKAERKGRTKSEVDAVICGHRVEEIEDPLMQKIRWLDKLIHELEKGKPMEKVLRS
ncbi:MAG: DUF2200 family protein [Saccharofermentanales bacterium]